MWWRRRSISSPAIVSPAACRPRRRASFDPAKRVDVRVEVGDEAVALHVCDEGDGFDPSVIPDPTQPERIDLNQGRGLFLIRQLVDEVHFNDRGNAICMIMRRA
jgi:serine/threonine-protein kinase RsbW